MSGQSLALLAAAAGVGLGHAVLPDHWVPLAVLGRTRRYPMSRIAGLSTLAGVAHVIVSVILGAVIIAVGLRFRSTVAHAQDTIIGCLLIATGIGFAVLEVTGHGHHHDHEHGHGHHTHDHHDHSHHHHHAPNHATTDGTPGPGRRIRGLAAVMVPFGAAASPDLTILPVFLAATAVGVGTAVGSVVIFASVTIGTIVGLTLAAARGGYQIHGAWLERWGNTLTATVLVIIGVLVLTAVI
jgi:nickel/cobalt transporter (NicO) family protein